MLLLGNAGGSGRVIEPNMNSVVSHLYHFADTLDDLIKKVGTLQEENKKLRETICDKES